MSKEPTNPFKKGQYVICVSEDFPIIEEYGGTDQQTGYRKPKEGYIIQVNEVLGDFLMFSQFNTVESVNWWHWTRFEDAATHPSTASMDWLRN